MAQTELYTLLGEIDDQLGDLFRQLDIAYDESGLDEYQWTLLQVVRGRIDQAKESTVIVRNALYDPKRR